MDSLLADSLVLVSSISNMWCYHYQKQILVVISTQCT